MLAHDVDRGVATLGMRSWTQFISTTSSPAADSQDEHPTTQRPRPIAHQLFFSLLNFSQRTVLDPQGLYTALNPAPITTPVVHQGVSQAKPTTQGKGGAQGKKGNATPQSPSKKGGRYVPPPLESSPSSLSGRVASDNVEAEDDLDRAGRIRAGALGAVRWCLGTSNISLFGSR